MKRSEFLEQIRTGKHPTGKHETVFEYFAREAVIAAEAAGVVWDPEEEPLPDRLTLFLDNAVGFQYGPESTGWTKLGYVYPDHRAVGAEAVRRYNAWPELESIVSELPDDDAGSDPCRFSCKLYTIRRVLRGS